MRVWLAPSRYAPHLGGIENVVAQLADQLAVAGDEVLIITHREPTDLPSRECIRGVPIRRLRFEAPARNLAGVKRFFGSSRSVQASLDDEPKPDLIHIHGSANQSFHLARYAKRRRVPLVLTTHGEISGDVHDIYGRSPYIRFSLRYAVRCATAVTAPSRPTLEDAAALAPGIRHKGHVVSNGVRVEVWQRCEPVRTTQRVFAWGRLEPQKGFDRLLRAWPMVRRQLPEAELRIAGDGGQMDSLIALVTPGVQLLGRLDEGELVRELGSAQLAAVPSRVEAFGLSALEALAGGRRVVHSGLPALSSIVGPYGWVAPHDDPAALAYCIVEALTSEPRPVPPEAVQRFEWPGVLATYRDLYRSSARSA